LQIPRFWPPQPRPEKSCNSLSKYMHVHTPTHTHTHTKFIIMVHHISTVWWIKIWNWLLVIEASCEVTALKLIYFYDSGLLSCLEFQIYKTFFYNGQTNLRRQCTRTHLHDQNSHHCHYFASCYPCEVH
jgi:hypothetical protein